MSRKSRRKAARAHPPAAPPRPPAGPPTDTAQTLPVGRPTDLTPDVHRRIVEATEKGLPITFAGDMVGLDRSTVVNWMRWGRQGKKEPFIAFFHAVKAARARYVASTLVKLREHGDESWQALAWLLERMHRDEFGGDKLELNQLKKELRDLRALLDKVPRASGEAAAEAGGRDDGGSDGPPVPANPSS